MPGHPIREHEPDRVDHGLPGQASSFDLLHDVVAKALEVHRGEVQLVRDDADDVLLARIERVPNRGEPGAAQEGLREGRLDVAVDVELLHRDRRLGVERLGVFVREAERRDQTRDGTLHLVVERAVGDVHGAEHARRERPEPLHAEHVLLARLRREERAKAARADLERDLLAEHIGHRHPRRREDRRSRTRHLDEPVVELARHRVEAMTSEDRLIGLAAAAPEALEHVRTSTGRQPEDGILGKGTEESPEGSQVGIDHRGVGVERHHPRNLMHRVHRNDGNQRGPTAHLCG